MLILATDNPKAVANDGRIVISVPSGDDRVDIALTLHQTLALIVAGQRAADDLLIGGFTAARAEVIKLSARRRKARRA